MIDDEDEDARNDLAKFGNEDDRRDMARMGKIQEMRVSLQDFFFLGSAAAWPCKP